MGAYWLRIDFFFLILSPSNSDLWLKFLHSDAAVVILDVTHCVNFLEFPEDIRGFLQKRDIALVLALKH